MLVIKETVSNKYPPRTYLNAKSADVTLAFAIDLDTAGERLTRRAAGNKYKGFLLTEDDKDITADTLTFLSVRNANSVNIATNLAKAGISQESIDNRIFTILERVTQVQTVRKVYCGGQTGVDIAAAKAAYRLGIPLEINMPKGFVQRNAQGKDFINTQEEIEAQL